MHCSPLKLTSTITNSIALQREMLRSSFHFPLHRYLAAFTYQAVCHMGMSLNDILPSAETLTLLMMHPLRVQVSPQIAKLFSAIIFLSLSHTRDMYLFIESIGVLYVSVCVCVCLIQIWFRILSTLPPPTS